ncbi:alpha/beta fold hydrolase [Streptomyces niveus]
MLLPHAGGSASVFSSIVKCLPEEIQPIPVELPGRGRRWRTDPMTTIDEALDDLVAEVRGLPGEFAIFGHSLGACLGLAVAARLEARGDTRCTTLFASASAAPSGGRPIFDGSPDRPSDAEILSIAERSGGSVAREIMEHRLLGERTINLLRADFLLYDSFLRKYRRTVTEASIVVCCGTDDVFQEEQLLRWSRHTTADSELLRFPGGHFYLADNSNDLAQEIALRIKRSRD